MTEVEEVVDSKLDELVKVYLTIRNERERIEAEWTVKDKELKAYVDQRNSWNSVFNRNYKKLCLTSAEDRQKIADMIDSDLSPENLTCDGELPRGTVIARHKQLTKVAKQLLALDPTVKFYEYA